MAPELTVALGEMTLRSPLIAASGTVGSVWEWAAVADVSHYGAAVAKSVAPDEWPGRPAPRMAPVATGMLNGIGIQNPGIETWVEEVGPRINRMAVPVWGSAVADGPEGFALVARRLRDAGVRAIEINLSCPNLEDGEMFSMSPRRSADVVSEVRDAVDLPVGAKLSPNTPDLLGVAEACAESGADFVVLTNTALGFGLDLSTRHPLLSGGVGGYSGPGLKPIALRCVYEVSRAMPSLPVVGCGGVSTGTDVAEYLMAGASAVQAGTIHLAEPKAGKRIIGELAAILDRLGVTGPSELVGGVQPW